MVGMVSSSYFGCSWSFSSSHAFIHTKVVHTGPCSMWDLDLILHNNRNIFFIKTHGNMRNKASKVHRRESTIKSMGWGLEWSEVSFNSPLLVWARFSFSWGLRLGLKIIGTPLVFFNPKGICFKGWKLSQLLDTSFSDPVVNHHLWFSDQAKWNKKI